MHEAGRLSMVLNRPGIVCCGTLSLLAGTTGGNSCGCINGKIQDQA
jgi:hypothetical protein